MSQKPSFELKQLTKDVHDALRMWHRAGDFSGTLWSFLLLVKEASLQADAAVVRPVIYSILAEAIDVVTQQHEILGRILTLRFRDELTGRETALELNLSLDQMNRRQRSGIHHVAQHLWERELVLRQERRAVLLDQFPPATYAKLFGFAEQRAELVAALVQVDAPKLLAIVGVGGIGKTALANAAVQQSIEHFYFEQILWVQVGHQYAGWGQTLPALTYERLLSSLADQLALPRTSAEQREAQIRHVLKARPHLVVIDNLEAETDTTYLLARLSELAGPSKFLLTTRTQPLVELDVFTLPLRELSREDSFALLKQQAKVNRSAAPSVAKADEDDLTYVHSVIGGNPLALKLVAHLINRHLPLSAILANLDRSSVSGEGSLYQRIYQKTWVSLSGHGRALLQAMVLVADSGAGLEQLRRMSKLTENQSWSAVSELLARSLLEAQGSINEPRYGIHRLTYSFLRSEVIYSAVTAEAVAVPIPFWEQVMANLDYWRERLAELTEEALGLLDGERGNIVRAIQVGMEQAESWETAVAVAQQTFIFVERRGFWREWLPLLSQIVGRWPENNLATKCVFLNQLGYFYQLNRDLALAVETHRKSEALAKQLGDGFAQALAWYQLSSDYYQLRQFETSAEIGEAALAGFRQATRSDSQKRYLAATLNQLGITVRASGDLELARLYLMEAIELWEEQEKPVELARSWQNLAIVVEELGEVALALSYYKNAQALLAPLTHQVDKARVALSLGSLYYNQKAWPEAQAAFEQAADYLGDQPGYEYFLALTANNLGSVLLEQGAYGEAETRFRTAVKLWEVADDEVSLANSLGGLGRAVAAQQGRETAVSYYEEALQLLAQYPNDTRAQRFQQEILAAQREGT